MNQKKIGKFISERRKHKNLTQQELANLLNISDRAVSKWERGINLPDASLMLELCNILDINVNELLTGEIISKENYMKNAEENLLEVQKVKEEKDKMLLTLEIVIGIISIIHLLSMTFIAAYINMPDYLRIIIIVLAFITTLVGLAFAIKIEQIAGYYECSKCHHKYIPTYKSVLWAMHINRTRYMKCPNCNKWSWNKKVLTK